MANYIDINPEIIAWAIKRSLKTPGDYSDRVQQWLDGSARPTLNQLKAFASSAMVPLGYLFLEQPPREELPVPDYRTKVAKNVANPTPNLIDTIYGMERRQAWMREYLVEEGSDGLPFVGSAKLHDDIVDLAAAMRAELELKDDWAQQLASWEAALVFLRKKIEDAGILLVINGIVGNNTRRALDPNEFQGFVFADEHAPLIFVNGADFKAAQMFTVAHELAHVWIGHSALFELEATTDRSGVDIENYCNQVAAEFLVPADRLIAGWRKDLSAQQAIKQLAASFKVSPIVIGRRALDLHTINKKTFFGFYNAYAAGVRAKAQASGGDFWKNQNLRIGKRFGKAVVSATREGRLTYTDAYDLTGLSAKTFETYVRKLRRRKPKQ